MQNDVRYEIIKEWIETEKLYCLEMEQLIKNQEQNWIQEKEIDNLFEMIKKLSQFINDVFLKELEKRFDEYKEDSKFCEDLLKGFQIYSQFSQIYENSRVFINGWQKMSFQFDPNNNKDMNKTLEFEYLLSLPFLRLSKYMGFLENLLNNTEESHKDYVCIQQGISSITFISNQIEIMSQIKKNNIKLIDLYDKYRFEMQDNLLFLWEESYVYNYLTESPLKCFFLNQAIIFQDIKEDKQFEFMSLDKFSSVKDIPDTIYYKNILQINGKNIAILIKASSSDQKEILIQKIQNEIISIQPFLQMQRYQQQEQQITNSIEYRIKKLRIEENHKKQIIKQQQEEDELLQLQQYQENETILLNKLLQKEGHLRKFSEKELTQKQIILIQKHEKQSEATKVLKIKQGIKIQELDVLKGFKEVESLWINLPNKFIGDTGTNILCQNLKHFSDLKNLKLSLTYNDIGEQGVKYLCDCLPLLKSLKNLAIYLNFNQIKDNSAKPLSECFEKLNNLDFFFLNISDNFIGEIKRKIISKSLNNLKNTIMDTNGLSPFNIKQFKNQGVEQHIHNYFTNL